MSIVHNGTDFKMTPFSFHRFLIVISIVSSSILSSFAARRVVDLTHSFSNTSIYWPGGKKFEHIVTHRGFYLNSGVW